jgi:hypothetical protein
MSLYEGYTYNNVIWDNVLKKISAIIADEYKKNPIIKENIDGIGNPFIRIWPNTTNTEELLYDEWHKQYSTSIYYYLKNDKNENTYKHLYGHVERIYELFSNNHKTTTSPGWLNGIIENINIVQEDGYFVAQFIFNCHVYRHHSDGEIMTTKNFWSLDFDGTNDYVDCGSDSSIDDIWSGGGTLSAWFNCDSASSNRAIASQAGNGNQGWFLTLENYSTGTPGHRIIFHAVWGGDDLTYTTDYVFPINTWHNIVVTYNSDTYSNTPKIYKNGVELTMASTQQPTDGNSYASAATYSFEIGRKNTSGHYDFNGLISQVGLWNVELSKHAIETLYNTGATTDLNLNQGYYKAKDNLVAYYRMGSGSGDDRATNGLIADQVNSSIGSELLTNGDFATWIDSNTIATWTHRDSNNNGGGGEISQVGSGEANGGTGTGSVNFHCTTPVTMHLTTPSILDVGKVYKFILDVSYYNSGIIRLQDVGDYGASDIINGKIIGYFLSSVNYWRIQGSDVAQFTIDNVTLQLVNGNAGVMQNFDVLDFSTNTPVIYGARNIYNSLVFDGVDDYVDISSIGDYGTGAFSWSIWFKCGNDDTIKYLLGNISDLNTLYITATEAIRFRIGDDSAPSGTRQVSTSAGALSSPLTWNHIIATRDDSNVVKIYLNGVEQALLQADGSTYSTDDIAKTGTQEIKYIGKESSYYVDATIADVALFSKGLNQANVTAIYNSGKPIDLRKDAGNYNNANNLIGLWMMGDGHLDELPTANNKGGILDQVTPVIDDKEYVNDSIASGKNATSDFSNGLDGYTIAGFSDSGDSASASNGKVTLIGNGVLDYIAANDIIPALDNNYYKLEIDVDSFTMGENGEGWGYSANGLTSTVGRRNITTTGKHIQYFKWTIGYPLDIRIETGGAYTADELSTFGLNTLVLNSVSVKKVNGNLGICKGMTLSNQSTDVPK